MYYKLSPLPLYLSLSIYIFKRFIISLLYVIIIVRVVVRVVARVVVRIIVLSLSSSLISFTNLIKGAGETERAGEAEGYSIVRVVSPNTA